MTNSFSAALGALFFCLLCTLFSPMPINFLAAPIVMLFYNASLPCTLWLAFLSGCFCDSLMLSPRFGFLGLSFALTSWLLYNWKFYFFKDSRLTIFIMTYCFSFVCTLVQNILALFFDLPVVLYSAHALFIMPLIDAIFAWTVFSLFPFFWQLYRVHIKRRKQEDEA